MDEQAISSKSNTGEMGTGDATMTGMDDGNGDDGDDLNQDQEPTTTKDVSKLVNCDNEGAHADHLTVTEGCGENSKGGDTPSSNHSFEESRFHGRIQEHAEQVETDERPAISPNQQQPVARFPGAFYIPGNPLIRPSEHNNSIQDSASINSELDRLGIPRIEDAVAIPVDCDGGDSTEDNALVTPIPRDGDRSHEIVAAKPIKTVVFRGKEIQTSSLAFMVCLISLTIVAIVTPTVLHLRTQKQNTDTDTPSNNEEPLTEAEMPKQSFESFLTSEIFSYSNKQDINNPGSPQAQALAWILDAEVNPKMRQYYNMNGKQAFKLDKLRERYSIAVIHFSMGGNDWTKQLAMDSNHQCSWNVDLVSCTVDGMRIESIRLGE